MIAAGFQAACFTWMGPANRDHQLCVQTKQKTLRHSLFPAEYGVVKRDTGVLRFLVPTLCYCAVQAQFL